MHPAIWVPSPDKPGWLAGRLHRLAHRTVKALRPRPKYDSAEFDARFSARYAEYEPRVKVTRYD